MQCMQVGYSKITWYMARIPARKMDFSLEMVCFNAFCISGTFRLCPRQKNVELSA